MACPSGSATQAWLQPKAFEYGSWQWGRQRRQECAVLGREPHPVCLQLALQGRELVAEHQDLGVVVMVTHGSSRSAVKAFLIER